GDEENGREPLEAAVAHFTSLYAATGDVHDPAKCPVPPEKLETARGIEVGQTFYFGTKYSVPMGAVVAGPDGAEVPLEMGSYGIGVSRLVGARSEERRVGKECRSRGGGGECKKQRKAGWGRLDSSGTK